MGSPLVPMRRVAAFASWHTPKHTLWLEWSAEQSAEIDDRAAWRAASPHWSRSRERLLEARLERVEAGETVDPDEHDARESFRSQFLNGWPTRQALAVGPEAS